MSEPSDKLIAECRQRLTAGARPEDLIAPLHDAGLSIVESIFVLRKASDSSLANAKLLVTSHPVWQSVVAAHEPLHDELERAAHTPL